MHKFHLCALVALSSFLLLSNPSYGQSFGEKNVSMANFVERMYHSSPFEGVKVIDDYDHDYLISAIRLDTNKYTSPSIMARVARVKSQSQVNTFFNGSHVSLDFVVKTTETRSEDSEEVSIETIESIKENAYGFVKAMEILTTFEEGEGSNTVFIYYKKI